jgi:hypothetical protein
MSKSSTLTFLSFDLGRCFSGVYNVDDDPATLQFFVRYFIRFHVKGVHCHHGIARPRVADGKDGLQIWRIYANILNNQSRTADNRCPSRLGVRGGGD